MKNVLRYAKTNTSSFSEKPFSEADALALSWLAYFSMPNFNGKSIKLKNLSDDKLKPDKIMFAPAYNPKTSKKLLSELRKNPRYNFIALSAPEEITTREPLQFGAVTLKIARRVYMIAFRGTDPSYEGWHENFVSSYARPVPSQKHALNYVKKAFTERKDAKFILAGHSKGGNLSSFVALNLGKKDLERIIAVYDFDGQGFSDSYKERETYLIAAAKIKKFVPQSSFVGLILNSDVTLLPVKSRSISLMQHDPFTWTVDSSGKFLPAKGFTRSSSRLINSFNAWINEMTDEERKRTVKIIYDAIFSLSAKDFNVFFRTLPKQILALIRLYKKLERSDKEFFKQKVKRLLKLFFTVKPAPRQVIR